MGTSALYYKMQNRYPQADVKSAMNSTVLLHSHLTFLSQFVALPGNKWWCLGLALESFLQYFMDENAVC